MILMIDEEIRRMWATKEYLEEVGYHVVLIGSIDEAKQFAEEHLEDIDAIILDIMMPWETSFTREQTDSGILTGYRFYQAFREKHGYGLPVVIYSALQKSDLFNRLKKEKNCSVVHKPDTAFKIVRELRKHGVEPSEV